MPLLNTTLGCSVKADYITLHEQSTIIRLCLEGVTKDLVGLKYIFRLYKNMCELKD